MLNLLRQAAQVAIPTSKDKRSFWLGCIGIRADGAMVTAKNGAVSFHEDMGLYHLTHSAHAEGRVLRKLGKGGIVYVARVHREDGSLAMARPCSMCQIKLRAAKVSKVYYTINEDQYGVWFVNSDYDRIYTTRSKLVNS